MRDRLRTLLVASFVVATAALAALPSSAQAAGQKVVVIVGPSGAATATYRSYADATAAAATSAGATVVKVYSPNATWSAVKAAVAGANVVVYYGHGNGFPNPYSPNLDPLAVDGWGLNRTTTNGDADNWATTMVYCGEAALTGATLAAGSPQAQYCSGGPISPAPGWVMIYANACYTPGAGEDEAGSPTSETTAVQRVANFSRPALALRAGAYFASDMWQGATRLTDLVLRNPQMTFGAIYKAGNGFDAAALRSFPHPRVAGAEVWVQRTANSGSLMGYWYAFAGNPAAVPGGSAPPPPPPGPPPPPPAPPPAPSDRTPPSIVWRSPPAWARGVSMTPALAIRFSERVGGVGSGNYVLRDAATGAVVAAAVRYDAASLTATLLPSSPLLPGRLYKLAASGSIRDLAGNPLAFQWWQFATTSSESYQPWRTIRFLPGTYVGYRFSSGGAVLGTRAYTLTRASPASTGARAAIPGRGGAWYLVMNGIWAGYWIPAGGGITVY